MNIKSENIDCQDRKPLIISSNLLLGIYLIVPASFITILVDTFFFHQALRASLPSSPESLRLFTVFFVLPHIVASAMTLFDNEYMRFYKAKLGFALPVICVVTIVLPIVAGMRMTFLLYATYTIYHVLVQQIGITRLLTPNVDINFSIWKWLAIGMAIPVYLYIYRLNLPLHLQLIFFSVNFESFLKTIVLVLLVPLTYGAWKAAVGLGTRVAAYFLWFNQALIVTALGAFLLNYPFFTIFVTRVVHDLTAFAFYITHDYNRSLTSTKNLLYGLLSISKIPIFVLGPFLALVLGNVVKEIMMLQYGLITIGLGFFHYYSEGIIWKRNAIHRRYVVVR